MLPHNKIIKTTVKEFLEPENLFQIGSSRSWVDDNGYYFIIVEFATNGYSKGASLNAGVSFLWESTESLNKMLSYNYGCDVSTGVGYVEYKNDDEAFQIVKRPPHRARRPGGDPGPMDGGQRDHRRRRRPAHGAGGPHHQAGGRRPRRR